ncbi:MAG TPA: DUF4352 domain-containing protein [Ktedonobacteraceae bacterium]|nr:DUF4352 domain-containing protein [Ktedonobacteraceae bacterium]
MFLQLKKIAPTAMLAVLLFLLAACSSSGNTTSQENTGNGSTPQGTAIASTTPQIVTPKSVSGSPGIGPTVISSPTAVPGGKPGSQQVVLGDRTLIISSVSEQKGTGANSTLVTVNLSIHNTSAKTIMNQPSFYELYGSGGDAFGSQYSSSVNFYGPIAANTIRSGTIVFQVPTAVASQLSLFYRPEIATETTIIALKTA